MSREYRPWRPARPATRRRLAREAIIAMNASWGVRRVWADHQNAQRQAVRPKQERPFWLRWRRPR